MTDGCTLYRCPPTLSLPTGDPHALALETLFRFAQVGYTTVESSFRNLKLDISQGDNKAERQTYEGFASCFSYLVKTLHVESVQGDLKPVLTCIEAIAVKCLFPAFIFLTHFEPSIYNTSIRKTVAPKVSTFWEGMTNSYRTNVLKSNVFYYTGEPNVTIPSAVLSVMSEKKMTEVLEEVEKSLKSLELLHISHTRADETFILGTARPSVADAYVYAGASSFLHADFSASILLIAFQKRIRDECPLLTKYVEKLRVMLYEEYNGTYNLKPCVLPDESAADLRRLEGLYSRGRLPALVWTGVFATIYFITANADMFTVDLVESDSEEGEEEKKEEKKEAPVAES
ncbi:hypothetical protein AGDE_00338 [Angomonas deanei]|uniref:Metaxin glutathione S-transferase domain-containing protein n=1 Tax=Angomonas deanei TaxID=59799 RepID=S9WD44_9TRYP|nr:hypothetical protein AGDE_08072 [Angomonas deanei]EPY41105.1 hypothetical protein AGDE_02820 [Angomonas deanei]EPY43583.1 hypothetical protein AGDE_00338 [Angomonas deanei]CAD2221100.1 hypothetical protein, conserved [Angomonas deanei]|eukprot:EPY34020.1 hypothetical protein AGDE_08072 [Angomonas deanei]